MRNSRQNGWFTFLSTCVRVQVRDIVFLAYLQTYSSRGVIFNIATQPHYVHIQCRPLRFAAPALLSSDADCSLGGNKEDSPQIGAVHGLTDTW